MAIVTATQKRENEGEEGRERREKGQRTAQKVEGVCTPRDVRTGGARKSEERGDRRAGGREGDRRAGRRPHRKTSAHRQEITG